MNQDGKHSHMPISGQDMRPSGILRVTTTDTLLIKLLTPCLAAFNTAYPEIELEVLVSNQFLGTVSTCLITSA